MRLLALGFPFMGLQYLSMTAFALAIFSAISGAVANLLARGVSRFAPPRDYLAVNFGLMFVLLLPAAPFFWQLQLSWQSVGVLLAAALVDLAANYFYFRSFEILDPVTASSILSLSPLISLFFLPLFRMGAGIGWPGLFGIVLVSVGLVMLSRTAAGGKAFDPSHMSKYWLPLAAAVLFGANVFIIKLLFTNQWSNPYTYYLLRALLIAIAAYVLLRPKHQWLNHKTLLFTIGRLVVVIAQWLALLIALDLGNPATVKALSDASPLFVIFLSRAVIKERINRWQALGAVVVLGGMALIALVGR